MPIRLGELLVTNNVITEHQLKEGLHAQTIFGGRLGTNLVELGYINELDLAKLLSAQLNIPCVEAGDFDEIDPEVIKSVPLAMVAKHRVVPLDCDEKTIRLAMPDPTNFPIIDEISFATGMRIDPVVAPEILLVYAAERYYEVPRDVRYIRASGMAQNLAETSSTASAADPRLLDGDADPVLVAKKAGQDRANEETAVDGFPLHQAAIDLVRARKPADILEVIRAFVSQDFKHAAIFLFKGEMSVGAIQVGCKLSQEEFEEFSFPVNSSEMLSKIWDTREPYVGLPTLSGVDAWVFSELGLPKKRPVVCYPVVANDNIRCIILASENKKGEVLDMKDSYALLAKKLGQAFELVFLVDQILDISEETALRKAGTPEKTDS